MCFCMNSRVALSTVSQVCHWPNSLPSLGKGTHEAMLSVLVTDCDLAAQLVPGEGPGPGRSAWT